MEEENIYYKQKNLYDPQGEQPRIIVYGVGSIGSHVVAGLTKTGFNNIKVIDFDVLEKDNLPAQFYSHDFKEGELKVDVLKRFIGEFTGVEIDTSSKIVDENTEFELSYNSIHIVCFDNIEGRKLIYNSLKGYPVHFIDGRIGGFNLEKYYVRMDSDDNYEKTLQGEFTELACGDKTLWSVNSLLASRIVADVIKITKDKSVTKEFKANLMSNLIISGE